MLAEDLHGRTTAPCRWRSEDSALGGRLRVTIPGGFISRPRVVHNLPSRPQNIGSQRWDPRVQVNQEPPPPNAHIFQEVYNCQHSQMRSRHFGKLDNSTQIETPCQLQSFRYSRSKLCFGIQMDPTPANSDFLHYLSLPTVQIR